MNSAERTAVSIKPFLRMLYWVTWFFAVPVLLAGLTVWLISPGDATAAVGPLAYLRKMVDEQPVPVAIVLFTVFVMLLWSQRHVLPLASVVGVAGRSDIPAAVRKRFEQASALLDEAGRLMHRNQQEFLRTVPATERTALQDQLDVLRRSMNAKPFERAVFEEAFAKADDAVDATLGRWRKGELREYGESIAIAITVALLLRAFVVEAFKIPSHSMVPTLAVGDHIFVNKFSFGPMIPWTQKRLFSRLPPPRGDVIVFQFPEHPEQDFIKRTIGLPGDRIEAIDGRPRINGWLAPRCYVGRFTYEDLQNYPTHHEGELYIEYLGKESYLTFFDHTLMSQTERRPCSTNADCVGGYVCAEGTCGELQGPYFVKPGETFMMGDNRMNSHDSRGWFQGRGGGVPFSYIKGSALWVWMSFGSAGSIAWDRVGVSVMGMPKLPKDYEARLHPRILECIRNRPALSATTPPGPEAATP